MALMGSTLYLPEEELNFRNYPEVRTVLPYVQEVITYAAQAVTAIKQYTSGASDRVDLSIVDLQKYTKLCRTVCSTLGSAASVCYELLAELRTIQNTLQTLMYIKNRYGSQYIGAPVSLATINNPNVLY